MDRLAAMRTFVEIVDRGSLTAAADALDRSQPSVVRSLAALEAHLGCVLLRRTTRRMSLTPEGEAYLARSRRILADVEEAEAIVGATESAVRGRVRIAAPVQFGQRHVAPALAALLGRHPALDVDLQLLDRVVDLLEEGIDLAVRIGPLADSSMIAVPVGEVRRVLCASSELLATTGPIEHPGDLAGQPIVGQPQLARGALVLRDGPLRAEAASMRFATNAIAAAVSACVSGLGFGQFLSYQVHDELARGDLVRVLEGHEPEPWPVHLLYPSARLMTRRLRVTIDELRDALRQIPGVGTHA